MARRNGTMSRRRFLGSAGALPLMAAAGASRAAAQRKPNLVWIWCDNLAYGDLGCYGNERIETPVLDRMAEEGVRFMQHYVAHTVCSPSRVALLTGRQPFRAGIVDVLRPDSPSGIPDDEITLGDALRAEGYATAAFGKWHLGDRREFLPRQHGFDHYYGLPYSMDMLPTVLYRDDEIIEELPGDTVQNVTERLIDDAISFVDANRDKPFFIYFSHTIPHPPLNIPPAYRHPDRTVYDDALEYMDEQTGRLLDALEKHGLSENTLVIFSSDNGPMGKYGDTAGLRGRIRDSHEGGVRVPMVARWPGKLPGDRVVDTPTIAYDIFPTFVRLAGGRVPDDREYDGQDIWSLLSGEGDFAREKPFYWVYLDNVTAMRDGKWKLHVGHREKALKAPELYDVEADPEEANALNDAEPEVLARMLKEVEAFQAGIPKVWGLQYPVRAADKLKSGVRRE
jgi:arylsulfatase A-like enzyme